MTEHDAAILKATGKWVEAKEAVLAVDEARDGNPQKRDNRNGEILKL